MDKIWAYIGLAYTLSWLALIPLIRLHANEEVLILGICGPAFAAMLLSRSRVLHPDRRRRVLWFIAMTLAGWVILILTSEWRGVPAHWPVPIKPWLIFPQCCRPGSFPVRFRKIKGSEPSCERWSIPRIGAGRP